jgi:hypothetical protein
MRSTTRWVCTGLLLGLILMSVVRRGPLTLRAPVTVVSNSDPIQRLAEPYLVFLKEVGLRVPRGATIVVISPRQPNESSVGTTYLLALGQLASQIVLPEYALEPRGSSAGVEWVACFRSEFRDSRFRAAEALPGGMLFRAVP